MDQTTLEVNPLAETRIIGHTWSLELVILSYAVSWLGAYTGTQLIVHAKYTPSPSRALLWATTASVALGFCGIWSMHFLGMLAMHVDVPVRYNHGLTALSAIVAVVFTFGALGTPFVSRRAMFGQWTAGRRAERRARRLFMRLHSRVLGMFRRRSRRRQHTIATTSLHTTHTEESAAVAVASIEAGLENGGASSLPVAYDHNSDVDDENPEEDGQSTDPLLGPCILLDPNFLAGADEVDTRWLSQASGTDLSTPYHQDRANGRIYDPSQISAADLPTQSPPPPLQRRSATPFHACTPVSSDDDDDDDDEECDETRPMLPSHYSPKSSARHSFSSSNGAHLRSSPQPPCTTPSPSSSRRMSSRARPIRRPPTRSQSTLSGSPQRPATAAAVSSSLPGDGSLNTVTTPSKLTDRTSNGDGTGSGSSNSWFHDEFGFGWDDDTQSGSHSTSGSRGDTPHRRRRFRTRVITISQDWGSWLIGHWKHASLAIAMRAAFWACAVVFMHYCGMWAMVVEGGGIHWYLPLVGLSYLVAFAVCFVACLAMYQMEVHLVRQAAVSTIAAAGVCGMHYTGMAAATFYTTAPSDPTASYPVFLPVTIVSVAVSVVVMANAVLANSAVVSRNRMAEMILTRRRLWRIMAEKEAAERANELRLQFISVASHEIRTPLHTVNGYAELLARTVLSSDQQLFVSSIQQACHAINVIAGNVLDFNKLDRANVESEARPVLVHPREMIENVARIGEVACQNQVELIVSVTPDVPEAVYLDETYAIRVLTNLLSNAQKFTQDGYISMSLAFQSSNPSRPHSESQSQAQSIPHSDRLSVQPQGSALVATVSDSGIGISRQFQEVIFQPFRQADSSLTRPHQGAGLGLSIVKHLVERMGGEIVLNSKEGEGSTFTVTVPVTLADGPKRSASQRAPEEHVDPSRPSLEGSLVTAPPCRNGGTPTHQRVAIVHRHTRTANLYLKLWRQQGFQARAIIPGETNGGDRPADTDIVWTDVSLLGNFRSLFCIPSPDQAQAHSSTILCVVHSNSEELLPFEPDLSDARNVLLVKRPVCLQQVVSLLDRGTRNADKYALSDPPKLRFAAPSNGTYPPAVDIPLAEQLSAALAPIDTRQQAVTKHGRVLLVEDNIINQRLGKRLLETLGHVVHTANNGQQAIDAIVAGGIDCCFMDCQMPILDGFSATRQIRELEVNGSLRGHLPIIALTANVTSESEDFCRTAGMDMFMPKPLKLCDLKSCLDAALNLAG